MRITSGLMPGHVLQRGPRGASASIVGTAVNSGAVTATLSTRRGVVRGWSARRVGRAGGGSFTARVRGLPVGGPYRLRLAVGAEAVSVSPMYIGDLWLMAGQSNMSGFGKIVDAPKPHPLVRCLYMDRAWGLARDPLHHLPESPDRVHNGGTQQPAAQARRAKRGATIGAGLGVWFGTEMFQRTGVPQGLIATAHGGTSMEQWDPAKGSAGGDSLYGSMLASLRAVGQPIAGVLWYQGCDETVSNRVAPYSARMQALIAAIRADQRQPRLPVAMVQLGRVVGHLGHEAEWNGIQEQQRLLPTLIPRLDVVATIDLQLDDWIHIAGSDYRQLGARLARVADRLVLGNRAEAPAPQPISARMIPGYRYGLAVEVRFSGVVGGLRAPGRALGFDLVDRQHRRCEGIAKTILDGDRAILELTALDRYDLRLMYGWGQNPSCNVTDGRGMPLPVFGPMPIAGMVPLSPWFTTWESSSLRAGESIARMPRPSRRRVGPLTRRAWDGGFVDQHVEWARRSGHAVCFATVRCDEAMEVELRLGYDGPIRLWVDQQEVHRDLAGTNPAIVDAKRIPLRLRAGSHRLCVLMATNGGKAWGFFLRFARLDAPPELLATGSYRLPVPG